jgi:hypothetical protein
LPTRQTFRSVPTSQRSLDASVILTKEQSRDQT